MKRNIQKWLSTLLTVAMIMTMLPTAVLATGETEVDLGSADAGTMSLVNQAAQSMDESESWDGSAAESFAEENKISSAAELKLFANQVNAGTITEGTYTLTADIDLNDVEWTAIGTSDNKFSGTFDGDNYTTGFSETWSDMGFTEANGWTLPTDIAYLPTLMGEVSQNSLSNLQGVTVTLDYDTEGVDDETISIEYGETLSASQVPAGTWKNGDDTLTTKTIITADVTYTLEADSTILSSCPCGESHDITGNWYPIITDDDFDSLVDGQNYYLLRDIDTTATITIDETINLCLNGKTIERSTGSFTDFSIITIVENGTLNLYDGTGNGTITGGNGTEVGSTPTNRGGGVLLYNSTDATDDSIPTMNLYGGNITDNDAEIGGGVYLFGTCEFNMYGGSITDNRADLGGGVYFGTASTFTMTDGIISGNYANDEEGGGVYAGGIFNMSGGTITDNYAGKSGDDLGLGGGVFTGSSSTFTMSGTASITGNTAYNYGGAVYATGTFKMENGTISDNISADGAGGVYLKGIMTMTAGSISGNIATGEGGGIYINDADASLTMNGGLIDDNEAGDGGGGVYIDKGGEFTMTAGTISNNTADNTESGNGSSGERNDGNGGGVYISAGTFNMSGGSIEYNEAISEVTEGMEGNYEAINAANGNGGGVYVNYGADTDDDNDIHAEFYMTGGTISNNTAQYKGGGVYVYDQFIMNSVAASVTENEAAYGGGVYINTDATGVTENVAEFVIQRGSVTNNTASNSGGGVYGTADSLFVIIDGELSGNSASTGDGAYVVGNMITSGSPIIQEVYLTSGTLITIDGELGDSTVIPVLTTEKPTDETPVTITKDAENYARAENFTASGYLVSQDDTTGEIQLTVHTSLTDCPCGSTHEDGDITWHPLTQAGLEGNYSNLNGYYYLAEDITLEKSINPKNYDLTLCLNGYTITGTGNDPVFKVSSGQTLTIYDGEFDATNSTVKYVTDPSGGEDIAVYGGLITGGASMNGGGVYVDVGCTFNMYGGTIAGNLAWNNGGGVYVNNDGNNATFNMYGGAILANTAEGFGGGIYVMSDISDGEISIENGDISYNTAQMGGGIYSDAKTVTIKDTTISYNTATCKYSDGSNGDGAGIYLATSLCAGNYLATEATLTNVKILNNTAERTGGGVYVETLVTANITNCTIDGNTAGLNGGGIYAGSYYDGSNDENTTNSTVTITNGTTISGNTALDGGGAYVSSDNFSMTDTIVSGNNAVDGAGIYVSGQHHNDDVDAADSFGVATLSAVTIKENSAADNGGGIYIESNGASVSATGTVSIIDNSAGLNGGAVYISSADEYTTAGTFTADSNYTISGNSSINNGAGIYNIGIFNITGAPSIADEIYLGDSDKDGTVNPITFTGAYTGGVLTVATAVEPTAEVAVVFTKDADVGAVDASDFTSTKSYYSVAEDGLGEFQLQLDIDEETTYYSISGTITDGANVSVSLVQGTEVIETTTTDSSGNYSFPYLDETGTYNVVATDGDKTVTSAVVLTDSDESVTADAKLSENSSTLVIEGDDTADVVVVGLNDAAETLNTSIVLTVANTDETADGATDISDIATGNTIEYLAIDLTDSDSTVIDNAGKILEIIVPYDFTGKSNVTIYRYHGDTATAFAEADTEIDGTFKLDEENGYIYIYTQYFSTYAVGYDVVITTSGTSTYSSTVASTDNGTVSLSATKSTMNSTVTITTTPDDGYEVGTVTVTYASGREVTVTDNGDGTYSYKQPGAAVTVTVTFVAVDTEVETEDSFFIDVNEDDWFYDAVVWAVDNGITTGKTTTTFAPDDINTRAEAATFLWRSMGEVIVGSENPFVDVVEGTFYYDAIFWGVENAITLGTSTTTFSPDMDCSRAHIITFLWRMMGEPVVESTCDFTDLDADAYYYDAVLWAVSEGVTNGTTDTTFNPDKDCTRAEIVAFLYRALAE